MGDFNGDGIPDATVTNSGANGVNVFLNEGDYLSFVYTKPAMGAGPSSIAAADFNGDGKLDLAVANSGSNKVTILLRNGDGTLATGVARQRVWRPIHLRSGSNLLEDVVSTTEDTAGTVKRQW